MVTAGGETATVQEEPPAPVVMSWIWLNAPFGVFAVVVAVGLPLWAILKFPEEGAEVVGKQEASRSHQEATPVADADREPALVG
jgi:hypothetical protein